MTVRWALAGLLSALALAACGNEDTPEQPGVEPGTTTAEAGLPEGWTLCANERAGYEIG